jgi:hypothetical protein
VGRGNTFALVEFSLLAPTLLLMTGCVSAKYKPAKKDTPPAQVMNFLATQPPVDVVVNTVIAFGGPGSWKHEAYWDEYVVTVTNHGESQLTVQSASLIGAAEVAAVPGREPWALEKTTRAAEKQGFGLKGSAMTQIGSGTAVVLGVAGAGAIAGFAVGGNVLISSGAMAAMGAAAAGLVAVPIFVGGTIYRNVSNRHDIEREFRRRQLVLPAIIGPDLTVQGSLFFPITPGPRRLVLQHSIDGESKAVTVDLTPIAGLHLKPAPPATVPGNPN